MRITYLTGLAFRFYPGQLNLKTTLPLHISVRNETHYDVLKLPRTCSNKEIREAFINLSKENHPDKHQNDPSMHNRFVKLNEAYRTLSKPSSRRLYDMSIGVKRKIGPPEYSSNVYSTTYTNHGFSHRQHSHNEYHDFSDPNMWHNMRGNEKPNDQDSYYGIKGIKKVSNAKLLWCLFAFTLAGVALQVLIIVVSSSRRSKHMKEESRKNSLLESMLKEKAKLYGNDHQIQILKNSLKSSYDFDSKEFEVDEAVVENKTSVVKEKSNSTRKENIVDHPAKTNKMKKTPTIGDVIEDELDHSIAAVPVFK